MPPIISAVICTYNRAEILGGAIESLCAQTLTPDKFEILIVDNASTDQTQEVVKIYQDTFPNYAIHWVYERQQGLGTARNTAINHVNGTFIAYLDDDARAGPTWLEKALSFLERRPDIFCTGGPILPFYTESKPVWFSDRYEIRSWGDDKRCLRNGEAFSGSNMIWRKDILQSIDGFREDIGVTGEYLSLGEETIAFTELWNKYPNALLLYSPELAIFHWVPSYKMKVRYYLKRAFIQGQLNIKTNKMEQKDPRWKITAYIVKTIFVYSARGLGKFKNHRYWQNFTIEEVSQVVYHIGMLFALLGLWINLKQK